MRLRFPPRAKVKRKVNLPIACYWLASAVLLRVSEFSFTFWESEALAGELDKTRSWLWVWIWLTRRLSLWLGRKAWGLVDEIRTDCFRGTSFDLNWFRVGESVPKRLEPPTLGKT